MAWAGSTKLPALYFRGCDLTAEWLLAKEHVRVRFPTTAPILIRRAPACATESPKLSLLGAAPRRRANFNCGENEIQASFISSASVGATPTPATNIYRGSDPAAGSKGIMQVRILPAAPLPDSVKVARRPVKPRGVGASPTLAAIFGRQADISWLHLSRKQDRHRRGRSITDAFRHVP